MTPTRVRPRAATLAVGCLAFTLATAHAAFGGWRTYTHYEGLAGDTVHCVLEARSGVFWFGTDQGASLHDGVTWRTFTATEGLGRTPVQTILEDRSGCIWVGHGLAGGGVSRFDGAAWRTFTTADGLADDNVSDIFEDRAGNLWFATQGGVSRFDGSSWSTLTTADGLADNRVSCILEDRAGTFWFGTGTGLSRYDGATWRTFTTFDGMAKNSVIAIFQDRAGQIQVAYGSGGGGVSLYDGQYWQTAIPGDQLPGPYVYSITEDRWGAMWYGTRAGACRWYNGAWRTYTETDGLGRRFLYSIVEDRSGALWFATNGGGVSRFDGSTWRTVTVADGLPSNRFFCATEDSLGTFWFGTSAAGVSRHDGLTWQTFTTASGLAGNGVFCALTDRAGNRWFGTDGGASRYDGSAWQTFTTANGLAADRVYCMLEDDSLNLWFGFRGYGGGVTRYDGSTWQTFTTADGLANDNVSAILQDDAGNLWFGTNGGGVSRYDGSGWQTFTTTNGLASNNVSSILQDRVGNLWFGTNDAGVSLHDGSHWQTFTTADGLGSNNVHSIYEDQAGALWFATADGGVTRYDGANWRTLRTAHGLASNAVSFTLEDVRMGALWFGTRDEGLSRYEQDRVPPWTVFVKAPPQISTSRNQSAVFGDGFGETQDVEFSWRLDGGMWSDWSRVFSWFQNELPDGTHLLEVCSRDHLANMDSSAAVAAFAVDATPPAPVIASPLFGLPVRGQVEVKGTAEDPRFEGYRVDTRPAGASSWGTPLASSSVPVTNATLATWDTSALPDGNYDLRLSVSDSLGLVGAAQVTVIVDNHAPFADATTPARVPAATGGDVFTTNSEAHLYFPPHAFSSDAIVTVAPLADDAVPETLPPGAVRVLSGYEITWSGAAMEKPARLEFSYAGTTLPAGTPSVYVSSDGATWRRLGGTLEREAQRLTLAITEPGRYALFAESAPIPGEGTLSRVSFTPRVFSPTGSFADGEVGIGFTLGRPASVTIRIYARNGRLIRDVVVGAPMGAGANLVRWDGTDRNGGTVPDGIYMVTVQALGETRQGALAVVR